MKRVWTAEELTEEWTATATELEFVSRKREAGRLNLMAQPLFYKKTGSFPRQRSEFAPAVVKHLAEQVRAPEEILHATGWLSSARSARRNREAILRFLGVGPYDGEAEGKVRAWLVAEVWPTEPSETRMGEALTHFLVAEGIERPSATKVERLLNSTRREYEGRVREEIQRRLTDDNRKKLDELLQSDRKVDAPLLMIREDPGRVGLETFLTQVEKVKAVQAIGLPSELLRGLHPETVKRLRRRSANDEPSRLREHPDDVRWTLLAVECASREAEAIDALVELLLQVVKRMTNRAEKRVQKEFAAHTELFRGRDELLQRIAKAAHAKPTGKVKDVVLPLADEATWQLLLKEGEGTVPYKRRLHMVLRASYGQHYRRLLPKLLGVLEFRSNNAVYKPLIDALLTLREQSGKPQYYKIADVPIDDVVRPKWREIVVEEGPKGEKRINRINYEMCVLESLRERMRSREVWAPGSVKYRNPDEDLPSDFVTRRTACYEALGLPLEGSTFVAEVRAALGKALTTFAENLPKNKGVRIDSKRKKRAIVVTPLEPQPEPANLEALKSEVAKRWPMTALLDVLKEADMRIDFTNEFETAAVREVLPRQELQARLLLAIYGLGTNAGMKRLMTTKGISYRELLSAKRQYLDKESLRAAARRVANATLAIRRSEIWGDVTSGCAADSTKFAAFDQNLMTEWHARYGGRGVMIYWHVEQKALCIYSQLKRCSSSEVAAMIEGLLHHGTDVEVRRQYVDSHGQSEVAFAFCRLLGFDLLPRLKAIASQRLYVPDLDAVAALGDVKAIVARPIDWGLIRNQYDEMVRYATALRERTADPESLLRRFTRNNVQHPTYRALAELGKAVRTIFLCRYLDSEELRREIHEGLNVVENWNGANDFVFFGRAGEVATNRLDEQELSVHALHLVQACLVYVNTLMLQRVLEEPEWRAKMGDVEPRALTPLIWAHVSPYGSFDLDLDRRLDLEQRQAA